MTYDVEYKKLALMLLPIVLRKSLMAAIVYLCVSPVQHLAARFGLFRQEKNYRLTHNGQVCYMRAILNDYFDPDQRRIEIDDVNARTGIFIYKRQTNRFLMLYPRPQEVIINRRGFGGIDGYDFCIILPSDLWGIVNENYLRVIVNNYKLASKRYILTYK